MASPLLEHIEESWPPAARAALPQVVREVARAIAPRLGAESRKAAAVAFGEAALLDAEREPTDFATLYPSVAHVSGVSAATAVELTQVILVALGRALGPAARDRLAGELPAPWCEMLEDIHAAAPVRGAPTDAGARTLAAGHAGADRSLSSAAPLGAQRGSIAVSDDPHADRKLASTSGPVASERTIAGRRPRG